MNNSKLIKRSLAALLSGFAGAIVFLLLSALVLSGANDPDKMSAAFGIAALFVGAGLCGFVTRPGGGGLPAALISGVLYAGILFALSAALGKGSQIPLEKRALIFGAAALLCSVISVLPLSASRRRRSSPGRRKNRDSAVNRYFEGK